MWPWLIPAAGAVFGGLAGYRQSGGNLGAGLLGAGLGAAAPGAARFAGTALAETPAIAGLLSRGSSALGRAAIGNVAAAGPGLVRLNAGQRALSGLAGALTPAGIGAGAAGLGAVFGPQLAGNAASAVAGPAKGAAGLAANAMGFGPQGAGGAPAATNAALGALSPDQQFVTSPFGGSPYDIINPFGSAAGRRTEEEMDADVQARNMNKLLSTMYPWTELSKKNDLLRGLAAAGVRQNIATQAQMLVNAQTNAQAMGRQAANQAGQALATQYQYS